MLAAFYDDSKTIDAKHKPAVVFCKKREIRWGQFKGFMKYDKQSRYQNCHLVDRLKHHKAYQQQFIKKMYPTVQGARCMDCERIQTGQQYGRETIGCPIRSFSSSKWNDHV